MITTEEMQNMIAKREQEQFQRRKEAYLVELDKMKSKERAKYLDNYFNTDTLAEVAVEHAIKTGSKFFDEVVAEYKEEHQGEDDSDGDYADFRNDEFRNGYHRAMVG